MSHQHQATNMSDDHYCPAELEAPHVRLPQPTSPDTAVFELPGESSLPTQSILHGASFRVGQGALPQANPWPFHLDDLSRKTGSLEVRRDTNVTSDTNYRLANPWPYHGIESDSLDIGNAAGNKKANENSTDTTISRAECDGIVARKPSSDLHSDKPVVELDGLATDRSNDRAPLAFDEHRRLDMPESHFKDSETTAPLQLPASTSTHTNPTIVFLNSPANTTCEPRIRRILRCSGTSENLNNITLCTQGTLSDSEEDAAISPEKPLDFTKETPGFQREHETPTHSSHNLQMQNQVTLNEPLHSQPRWQMSTGMDSQPPPPYSLQESTASSIENMHTESHVQSQSPFASSINTARPSVIVPEPSAPVHTQGQSFSAEPRFPPEAPPLPPRHPTQTKFMTGLSNGPHNNVAFPPPPKRHNVTPSRFSPPTPQRPMLSSSLSPSKFLGSSSAKKWFEKTNQVIEDTLDAVLQGPAGHPSRPAYSSRPAQNSSQQTPQSSMGLYNSTQERRNYNI